MKVCSKCRKVLPLAEFCGGKNSYSCIPCMREYRRKYYLRNKDKLKRRMAENHQRRMQDPEYRKKHNANHSTAGYLSWYHRNKDKAKAIRDRYRAKPETKARRAADCRRRQARKMQAQPDWANQRYINLFYKFAKLEQERVGKPVEVDHIIPLQHPAVCGLHCEQNLQLLMASANKQKSNTFNQ